VEAATRAVEGDSADRVVSRWRRRLTSNPDDRAALLGIATVARLTSDHDRAQSIYAGLLARRDVPDALAVQARLGLAGTLAVRGDLRAATESYALAAHLAKTTGDSAAVVEALANEALLVAREAGVAAADSMLAAAAPFVRVGDDGSRAIVHCTRARLLVLKNQPSATEARTGARLARLAGQRRTRASCLFALFQEFVRQGHSDSMHATSEELLVEQRAARDRAGVAATLRFRGHYRGSISDVEGARRDLADALREATAIRSEESVGWTLWSLANLSIRTGDTDAGIAFAARAEAIFQRLRLQAGLRAIVGTQGDVFRAAGRTREARASYARGLEMAERLNDVSGILSLRRGLVDLALMERDWSLAERELARAEAIARERRLTAWERGLAQDRLLLALGRRDAAMAQTALDVVRAGLEQPIRRYRDRARTAEVLLLRGEVDSAGAELGAAMDALDRWRARLSDRELRQAAFETLFSWADADLGIATVLAALSTHGQAERAFELAERGRARELLDQVVRADAARPQGATGRVVADSARRARAGISAGDFAAAIPDDETALVEYVTGRGGEPTTLFVVTRAGLTAHQLPPIDSIENDVVRYVRLVESGAVPVDLSRSLGERLIGPALHALPPRVRRLVVVPTDVLHRLPFETLRVANQRPLVERYAISLAPSAAVLAQLWSARRVAPSSVILAMGDPRFGAAPGADDDALHYQRVFAAEGGLPRLRASGDEARAVGRFASAADVRLRGDASEAWLKRAPLDKYGVLHFATHARVDDYSVRRTALALSPGDQEDGFLTPGDVAALSLPPSLVVLSGCRTAAGVTQRGEGVQGLTAPFIEAGSRAVVATAWRISDRRSVPFVEAFYRALADGQQAGDALRSAKLDAVRRGVPMRDWAAFTLVGDPTMRVPLRPKRP
jgi:hypothetical protein